MRRAGGKPINPSLQRCTMPQQTWGDAPPPGLPPGPSAAVPCRCAHPGRRPRSNSFLSTRFHSIRACAFLIASAGAGIVGPSEPEPAHIAGVDLIERAVAPLARD